jgi:predicted anti-sigma-YlaC factor YlaD
LKWINKPTVKIILSFLLLSSSVFIFSCSPRKMIVNMAAKTLTGGNQEVFASDDDPELIAEAMPFALKLQEMLLKKSPQNRELLLSTASGFIIYAHLFVRGPSEMLPEGSYEEKIRLRKRAKRLYLRGVDYALSGLEETVRGFRQSLKSGKIKDVLDRVRVKDVDLLYWSAAGIMGAISADPVDMELTLKRGPAIQMMKRALELDEDFEDGAIHEFFISLYGSLPASMGGSEKKARKHFRRAVKISRGRKVTPYVALASTVCVKKQNIHEFKELLNKGLAIQVDRYPKNRLVNIIARRKARWLLNNAGNFFLIESEAKK